MAEKQNRITNIIGPSDPLSVTRFDSSRTINMFVELSPLGAGKNLEPGVLIATPGLRPKYTFASGPVRALYTPTADSGTVYVVVGNRLYYTEDDFGTVTEIGSLFTSTGYVAFADNGTGPSDPSNPTNTPSTSIVLVDGTAGYTFRQANPTTTFAQLTDPHFYPASTVSYQDGYFIFNVANTGYFFVSDVNATTFQAFNAALKAGSGDKIVSVVSNNRAVYLLGAFTCEKYWNVGGSTSIIGNFVRTDGWFASVGCSSAASVRQLNNGFFWVGPNEQGLICVYSMQGEPTRISNVAVEGSLQNCTDVTKITAYAYQQRGHWFYAVNAPGVHTTWVYDTTNGLWCERQSYSETWNLGRHLVETCTYNEVSNLIYAGSVDSGEIFTLDLEYALDGTRPIYRERTFPPLASMLYNMFISMLQVEASTGVGLAAGTENEISPKLLLEVSRDGGYTFSAPQPAPLGPIGRYKTRARWNRLGYGRDFVFRITCTDPVPLQLLSAYFSGEVGRA